MRFVYRYWCYFTLPVCLLSAVIFMAVFERLDARQIWLLLGFMALLLHQFEEYVFPGDTPLVLNYVLFNEKIDYDRYPGNSQSSFWVNMAAYPFYLLPVFLPQTIWLGLAQVFFGFFQFVVHGIIMNIKGKTLYNPGLLTVIGLHIPFGIGYLHNIKSAANSGDYLLGVMVFALAVGLITVLPVQMLKNRRSLYPFTPQHTRRFNMIDFYKNKGI